MCFWEIISPSPIESAGTFVSFTVPTLTEPIAVRNIPAGAPGGSAAVGCNPAASATGASTKESTFPVSMPIFKTLPSPIRASMHGVPSQSSSGTSVANFVPDAPLAGGLKALHGGTAASSTTQEIAAKILPMSKPFR